jgi:hypothetical protein
LKTEHIRLLNLYGEKLGNGVAGTTADITVLERDYQGKISRATGTDVPVDETAGYAKGCVFIDTNVAAGTSGRYTNVGTTASCNFDLEGTVSSGSVTADDLATAVTPSHVVKYAGEVTWTGGLATLASTVTGVAATDIVIASIHTLGTQGTILQGAVASANTITFTLDAANTSNDAVISYVVFRAVA